MKRLFSTVFVFAAAWLGAARGATFEQAMVTGMTPPDGCAAPTPASSFSTSDAAATLWFVAADTRAGEQASYKWFSPDGGVFKEGAWSALTDGGSWCFNTKLPIAGDAAASLPGSWTVKVYWNGVEKFQIQFSITGVTQAGLRLDINQVDATACPAVRMIVSVLDGAGRPVTGLGASNFTLKEGGTTRQITVRPISSGTGISLALLIDTSGSVSREIDQEKAAAKRLIAMLGPNDEVAIIRFSDVVDLVQDFTTNRTALEAAIDRLVAGGGTPLYEAMVLGAQKLSLRQGRKAMVLLTDGENESVRPPTWNEAMAAVKGMGAPLYTVGFGDANHDLLTEFATAAGGFHSTADSADQLEQIFESLGKTLTNVYEITFNSAAAAGSANLELTVQSGGQTASATKTFAGCGAAVSSVVLTVEKASARPGASVDVPVTLQATGARPANFQLDVTYDAQKLTFNSAKKGEQTTNAGKDVTYRVLSAGKVRVLSAGVNQNAIADGAVALMNFTLAGSFAPGTTSPLACSDPASTDGLSKALPTTCKAGSVTATAACTCDVNADGSVNVMDVQLITNRALGLGATGCDLNSDGAVNVADVQIVVNAALGLGCAAR